MAYPYFKVPFTLENKQGIEDTLKENCLRFATEDDYLYFTLDLGSDTDGVSEALLRKLMRGHQTAPYAYIVDHKVRDDHFYQPPKKRTKGKR